VSLHRWLGGSGGGEDRGEESRCVAIDVEAADWRELAKDIAAAGGRLLALWGSNRAGSSGRHGIRAVAVTPPRVLLVRIDIPHSTGLYPGITDIFPSAGRLQRALFDMNGWRATESDQRPWLRHAAWPVDFFPLRDERIPPPAELPIDDYSFIRVEGDGVHEIPVGPVHAGIIEPGHFRFSVVGEKVLRLEERLGYVHKGIERRFGDLPILEGHRLAARVSGDSGVAYSWAYCDALERMTATPLPRRATWLRALALELERAANHLGDLGALGNDAGFAFGLAQFLRLKEQLLRAVEESLGQRYLLDFVVPGGTARDLSTVGCTSLVGCLDRVAAEAQGLRAIYDDHSGLRDRFSGAGRLDPELANWLGVVGLAGRASGQPLDLRLDLMQPPYVQLNLRRVVHSDGDVLARVALRFDELAESLRLAREILLTLPSGPHRTSVVAPPAGSSAVGLVEGWRGPVLVALEAGPDASIDRCHPQDPSWHNWTALEHAIIGNIVPDFPLINKSFNLSYSGHDL
jgi:Ni,Fe-hydrogenase III large subunit/Ni,Fe-hydrogenase III component G